MQIRRAERKKAKLRLGISAPSGAGKTYSSLLIAYGITGDWSKVGLIDTENGSGDLYAHLGDYSVIPIEAPYSPDKYIQAITLFENSGFEAIIVDSLTHAWAGEGGILDIQSAVTAASKSGNSYTAWREVTPKHNALVNAILKSKCHMIATMRAKTDYVQEKNEKGYTEIKKVGLAPIQRDGMEYEFTVMMDVSITHVASASKDRTSLFDGQFFKLGIETGQKLSEWLETGTDPELQRQELLATAKEKWNECADKEDIEGFTKWVTETRKKSEETITTAELQGLISALVDKLNKKGEVASA